MWPQPEIPNLSYVVFAELNQMLCVPPINMDWIFKELSFFFTCWDFQLEKDIPDLHTLRHYFANMKKCGPKQKSQGCSYNFVRIMHKVYFVSWFVIFKLSIPSSRNIAPLLIK